ncbi:hypothetical protein EWE75_09765 [Sphingomonas populi]|uniref:Uncharacterized protein n=1 Tax=Sphingomonas populi TaxID=2484750 RepID=A0A4Q6Y338_9SPHN|nr:hypothetical protein [Sphingomonas populi]RZF64672.1 hypothetical protein EWE75_09765 [Sphingomonas populi]
MLRSDRGTALQPDPVQLARERLTECRKERRAYEMAVKRGQHTPLQFITADGRPIIAGALVARAVEQPSISAEIIA